MGRGITTMATYFSKQLVPNISSYAIIQCYIPSIKLGSGDYLLSFSIGTKEDGLLDSVENAAWLKIAWNNYYGNGTFHKSFYGPVLTESEWKVESF